MLSAECGKTPEAYIRDKAVNGIVYIIDDEIIRDKNDPDYSHFNEKRNSIMDSMNSIAHTVNANKCVYKIDVEEAEKVISEFEEFAGSLKPVKLRKHGWIWQ